MVKGARQRLPYRRRRSGDTDFYRRLKLLKSGKPRAVIRISNTQIQCQFTEYVPEGDKILYNITGATLVNKFKWPDKHSKKSIPASYLAGFALGKQALSSGHKEAILDIGLASSSSGSRVFAALKGMIDAGLAIPYGEEVIPSDDRINGVHIDNSLEKDIKKTKKTIEGAFK